MVQNESSFTKSDTSKPMSDTSKKISKRIGHWDQKEHDTYLEFFRENPIRQKGQRLFKRLSQLIGTRSPSQCRSHHQKFNPFHKGNQEPSHEQKLTSKQIMRQYFIQNRINEEEEEELNMI